MALQFSLKWNDLSNNELIFQAENKTIDDLWKLVEVASDDDDDGFGVPGAKKKPPKKKIEKKVSMGDLNLRKLIPKLKSKLFRKMSTSFGFINN